MKAKLLQRMPVELHGQLKCLATENNVSVNTLVNQICEWFFAKDANLSPVERRLSDLESRVGLLESAGAVSSTKAPAAEGEPAVSREVSQSVSAFTW